MGLYWSPNDPVNNGFYGVSFSSSGIQSGNLYAQFELTATTAPTSSSLTVGRIASFWNGSGGYRGRVWIGTGFDAGENPVLGTFQVGITEAAGSRVDVQWFDANFDVNEPVVIVVKYDFALDSVSLYANPASEDDVHIEVDDGGSLSIKGFAFRHKDESTDSTNLGAFQIDNLSISTTFGDTTPGDSLGASNLIAGGFPGGGIFLSWKDNSFDETYFRVDRREGSTGDFSEIAQTSPNRNSYHDTAAQPEVSYQYQIVTHNGADLEASNAAESSLFNDLLPITPPIPTFMIDPANPTISFPVEVAGIYQLETSPDLHSWSYQSRIVADEAGSANLALFQESDSTGFARLQASRFSVPIEQIGLLDAFEMPQNGGGTTFDLLTFGATPDDSTDDDSIALNAALDQMSDGDVLTIAAGTYHLNSEITVPSGITIQGEDLDSTRLVSSTIDTLFTIPANATDITLAEFSIDASDTDLEYGVFIGQSGGSNAQRIWIHRLDIQKFSKRGIQIRNANHVKVESCSIHHASNLGGGGFGYGIALNDPNNHNNWITDCLIGPVIRHGILIQFSAHNNLVENNVCFDTTEDAYDLHGEDEYANELRFNTAYWTDPSGFDGTPAGFGIGNTGSTHDNSGPNNWIHHNEAYGYHIGLEVIQGSHLQFIDGNRFYNNASEGIRLHDGGGNGISIRGNILTGNQTGISASRSSQLRLIGNTISDNELGIRLTADIEDYSITGNDLRRNEAATSIGSNQGVYDDNLEYSLPPQILVCPRK